MDNIRPEVLDENYVPGEGPDDAAVMLIGQNPGREEAEKRKPFVGRSGKYLDTVLAKNGIDRRRLYITSVVKHPTPRNRRPTEKEIIRGLPLLLREIEFVHPKTIVLMGTVAWKTPRLKGIKYFETYHPAAAMRFPKVRKKFEADFRELKAKNLL